MHSYFSFSGQANNYENQNSLIYSFRCLSFHCSQLSKIARNGMGQKSREHLRGHHI